MQLADNPGRHEPGTGEINYAVPVRAHRQLGYQGWIGCEYKPTRTEAGLGWRECDGGAEAREPPHPDTQEDQSWKIGFIGLGIMGAPMAGTSRSRAATISSMTRAECPARARRDRRDASCARRARRAEQADIVIIMVPDTPDVEEVLFGETASRRACRRARRGRHELDLADRHQGVREEDQRARLRLSRRAGLRRRGRREGGEPDDHGRRPARRRSSSVKPLFELMGKNITLVGGNGDGQTTKVANQIIVALTIEAVGEALRLRLQGRRRSGQGAPGADGRLRRRRASSRCTASA